MDHKTSPANSSGQLQKQRKVVVYPTQRSMSVVKANAPKFIPHEPVRGAVSPLDKKSVLHQDRVSENVTMRSMTQHETSRTKTQLADVSRIGLSNRAIGNIAEGNRCQQVQQMSSEQLSKYSDSFPKPILPYHDTRLAHLQGGSAASVPSSEGLSVTSCSKCPLHEEHANLGARLMLDSSSAGERTSNSGTDGGPRLKEEDQLNTSNEVTRLKEELEVLMKVNSDLKKLLVASIGDDLQYKVDALVRTKVQLANEIGDYTRKLVEDYEDLDKLSIQADLWYSKYQASRVLVEQLTSECNRLNGSLGQAQMALQYDIQERHELQELLMLARRNLLALVGTQKPSGIERFRTKRPHTLDLAIDIKRLSDTACRILAGGIPQSEPDEDTRSSFTPAELLTHQVLSSVSVGGSGSVTGRSGSTPVTRHPPILLPRFHPGARYEGFTFACCARCKGEVLVL